MDRYRHMRLFDVAFDPGLGSVGRLIRWVRTGLELRRPFWPFVDTLRIASTTCWALALWEPRPFAWVAGSLLVAILGWHWWWGYLGSFPPSTFLGELARDWQDEFTRWWRRTWKDW